MGFFGGLSKGMENYQTRRRQNQADQIDQALKYAQLSEAGYQVSQEPRGRFGGGGQITLSRDPSVQTVKDLQRKKLELENKKLERLDRMFGGSPSTFGGNSSQDQFIMTPDGRVIPNPAIPKQLNELQQAQLEDRKRKQQEAEQFKVEQTQALKDSAQENIDLIENVKKGKKYFGVAGDLPSRLAPSSLIPGEYEKRSDWEANVNNLLSKKVIEVMNNMKRASKNGATGFGALNKSELDLLKNSSTVINRTLSPDVAEKYLNDLENINKKILGGGNSGGMVQMISPEGDLMMIPTANVGQAKKEGFKQNG